MIGIISAMHEEIDSLMQAMETTDSFTKGKRTYFQGKLFDKDVVLVFSRWGKTASATTATQLINDFEIDEIIFTGVAGSVSEKIDIGDVVIGRNLYHHDMDASPILPRFEIPLLKRSFFETDPDKRVILKEAAGVFVDEFKKHITQKEKEEFLISFPKVHITDIGSGDQFINSEKQIRHIKDLLPTVGCIEMEGASVAQVCYEYQVPFSIIRTISDKANDNAHIDFPLFAKVIASKYALGILKNYLT